MLSDGSSEGGLAMINMPDCAHVQVRLVSNIFGKAGRGHNPHDEVLLAFDKLLRQA